MPLLNVAYLYTVRLKAWVVLVQELFAVLGIAAGVALLFASQVASTSLNGSISQLTSGVVGQAKYQLKARDAKGFSESLFTDIRHMAGVRTAIPVLELQASVTGRDGTRAVDFFATDPRFAHRLVGPLLRRFSVAQLVHQEALAVPAPIAQAIGAGPLETVKLQLGGKVVTALVGVELTSRSIGPLVHSPLVIAPLAYAQSISGLRGRITRVFVQPQPGADHEVQAGLQSLAAGRLNVQPASFDATLFDQAASPINQSTKTFAAICAFVGFMFAYCAMLLTIDLRRDLIKELRRAGATRWETGKVLIFDALVLGITASTIGLALGDLLSLLVAPANAGYLSFAFPVGDQRIVTWQSIATSTLVGFAAASIGVISPARDLWTRAPRTGAGTPGRISDLHIGALMAFISGIACLVAAAVISTLAPGSAVVGIVALLCGLLFLLPTVTDVVALVFDRIQRLGGRAATEIAALELRSFKTRVRSITIAAVTAIAVFASVMIQGSHTNLQAGLDRSVHQLSAVASLWVMPPGQQDLLATDPLTGAKPIDLRKLPGVQGVGLYRASFLEYGNRRVWVLAPPTTAMSPIPPSEVVAGNLATATAKLREGGWVVMSQAVASEHDLHIGQAFTLPTVLPLRVRLAATTTNLGWPPGAMILGSADYTKAWPNTAPSAYNIILARGASEAGVKREVEKAIGPASGLGVQTAREREQRQITASREGLERLTQISVLVIVVGVLATVFSMSALIWQRRRRFARMKIQGYATGTLWFALMWESVLLFGSGCAVGAVLGMYGQLLLSHALLAATGFPVMLSVDVALTIDSFALVTVVAAIMVGVPGYRTARVAPYPYSWTEAR
jgi:putative ABC transport system permease protein